MVFGDFYKMSKKKTTKEFILQAHLIHNNKYDYSDVKYTNAITKVNIICPKHQVFYQTPNDHLSGKGCPICAGKNKTTEIFIMECNLAHNNKYDYSLVKYNGAKSKINIICKKHGVFLQTACEHLYGNGCPVCKMSKGELKIKKFLDPLNHFEINLKKIISIKKIFLIH